MERLIIAIITLSVLSAMPAQAKLGETEAQIIKRFGIDALINRKVDTSLTLLEFGRRNNVVVAIDQHGRSIFEFYRLRTGYNASDANEIAAKVLGGVRWHWTRVDRCRRRTTDGAYELMLLPGYDEYRWSMAVGYTVAVDAFATGVYNATAPAQPQPQPRYYVQPTDPSRTPADCGIIAAQAYSRLKPATSWCQVLSARLYIDGQKDGHAVVAFKYQPDGHVQIYDENGTLELPTTSEDIAAIWSAWEYTLSNASRNPYGAKVKVLDLHLLTH
jgi:hypothetical protein